MCHCSAHSPPDPSAAFLPPLNSKDAAPPRSFASGFADSGGLNAGLAHGERLKSLGLVACGVAHELKNLLTPLVIGIELTATEIAPDHPAQNSLAIILGAARRAGRLAQRFSDYGTIRKMNVELVALDEVVDEALALLRPTLQEGVEIRIHMSPNLPLVFADNIQVHQVVSNLIINAWQALVSGRGVIEIALAAEEIVTGPRVQPMSPTPGQYVRFTVTDNGGGMDDATRARIFDEFFTTKAEAHGTGLGLAIVRAIVLDCGGGITVESAPDRGSIFNVYWPTAAGAATSRSGRPS